MDKTNILGAAQEAPLHPQDNQPNAKWTYSDKVTIVPALRAISASASHDPSDEFIYTAYAMEEENPAPTQARAPASLMSIEEKSLLTKDDIEKMYNDKGEDFVVDYINCDDRLHPRDPPLIYRIYDKKGWKIALETVAKVSFTRKRKDLYNRIIQKACDDKDYDCDKILEIINTVPFDERKALKHTAVFKFFFTQSEEYEKAVKVLMSLSDPNDRIEAMDEPFYFLYGYSALSKASDMLNALPPEVKKSFIPKMAECFCDHIDEDDSEKKFDEFFTLLDPYFPNKRDEYIKIYLCNIEDQFKYASNSKLKDVFNRALALIAYMPLKDRELLEIELIIRYLRAKNCKAPLDAMLESKNLSLPLIENTSDTFSMTTDFPKYLEKMNNIDCPVSKNSMAKTLMQYLRAALFVDDLTDDAIKMTGDLVGSADTEEMHSEVMSFFSSLMIMRKVQEGADILDGIVESEHKSRLTESLFSLLIEKGYYIAGVYVINKIGDNKSRFQLIETFVFSLIDEKRFLEAKDFLGKIGESECKSKLIKRLAMEDFLRILRPRNTKWTILKPFFWPYNVITGLLDWALRALLF
jgi:hypothetical protein